MLVVSTHPSDHRHTNALREALKDIYRPGWAVVFGDRREMCEAALDLHYKGYKLVHVGGGDTPHGGGGHPDHRTRDAISMLATVHCVANEYAFWNLRDFDIPLNDIHITGSPGLDEVVLYESTIPKDRKRSGIFQWLPEDPVTFKPQTGPRLSLEEFLHKLAHCELFVSNSSAALYEAPILGTPVQLVGNRQADRCGPYHHPKGEACAEIRKVVLEVCV